MITFEEVVHDVQIALVERLAGEIWREHFIPIVGAPMVEYMLGTFQSAPAIKQYLRDDYHYFLTLLDGVPVGYIAFLEKKEGRALFLSKLYLLASSRGKGVGSAMMAFVKDFARQAGLKKISLNTNKKNLNTICFYEKAGFVNRGPDVRDLGDGFVADDWLMEFSF